MQFQLKNWKGKQIQAKMKKTHYFELISSPSWLISVKRQQRDGDTETTNILIDNLL